MNLYSGIQAKTNGRATSASNDRGFVNFDTNNTPFINFQTAEEELRDDDDLFKLSTLSNREESKYIIIKLNHGNQ